MTQWRGQQEVKNNMAQYGHDVKGAAKGLADRWAVELENYAKDNAPWDDKTTNARQSLYSVVDDGNGRLIIYLSHGMPYGVWLELKNQGRYAIILATLEHYQSEVMDSFRRLLR